jgi:hypothetical protein
LIPIRRLAGKTRGVKLRNLRQISFFPIIVYRFEVRASVSLPSLNGTDSFGLFVEIIQPIRKIERW